MARPSSNVEDALARIRPAVAAIIADGDDPVEVLALGTLVRCHAPDGTDLAGLRDSLEHSTLAETVGDVAAQLSAPGEDDDALEPPYDDGYRPAPDEEEDPIGED